MGIPLDPNDPLLTNPDAAALYGGPYGVYRRANNDYGASPGTQGVFSQFPLATPKYAKNNLNGAPRDAEYKDTLARLYISLSDLAPFDQRGYLTSIPKDPVTQSLAKVLLGSGSGGGTGYVEFFLQQVNETFQEIMQIDKVLSDDYVSFFFGQQPPVFQYAGSLLNSLQDDQRTGFARAYATLLRGTQLARRGALVRLRYDSVLITGVMTAHQQSLNADNEMIVPFSFSLLVKEYIILRAAPVQFKPAHVALSADLIAYSLKPEPLVYSGPLSSQVKSFSLEEQRQQQALTDASLKAISDVKAAQDTAKDNVYPNKSAVTPDADYVKPPPPSVSLEQLRKAELSEKNEKAVNTYFPGVTK